MRAVLSIATRDHAFQAELLSEGLAVHAPALPHLVLVPDAPDSAPAQGRAQLVPFARVVPDAVRRDALAFRYTPFELCCALKPVFAAWALRSGYTEIVYLDTDVELVAPLPEDAWPGDAALRLTPHALAPLPASLERKFLRYGIFNAGYFAASSSTAGLQVLDHWASQCAEHAHDAPGLFVDQLWLNLAPTLFPAAVAVSRSPRLNVGYWNFHERSLTDAAFFHWSRLKASPFGEEFRAQWDAERARRIDELAAAYAQRLAAAAARAAPAPRAFGAFTDGTPITAEDRYEFGFGTLRGLSRPFAEAAAFADVSRKRAHAARRARLAGWRQRLLGL